jgi:hypothetical protein
LSPAERVAQAEYAAELDADAHYWRTLARYAALACDPSYIRTAKETPPHRRTHEQVSVLLTYAEDKARRKT